MVHAIFEPDKFKATGNLIPIDEADRLRSVLLGYPLYAALNKSDPAAFEKFVAELTPKMEIGRLEDIVAAARKLLLPIIRKYVPLGSEDTIIALARLNAEYMTRWRQDDVQSCVAFAEPTKRPNQVPDAGRYKDLFTRETALYIDVIQDALKHQRRLPSEAEVQPDLLKIAAKLELAHPGKLALFDKPLITESDARDFCDVNLSFMWLCRLPLRSAFFDGCFLRSDRDIVA